MRIALILIIFLFSASQSFGMESDFASWAGTFFQGKFSKNWGWYFESQTRINVGSAYPSSTIDYLTMRNNRFLARPAARWLPTGEKNFQIFLGYGWTPNFSPYRNENRLWQQALYQVDSDDLWWIQRVRLEERWIAYTSGVQLRARYFIRLQPYLVSDRKIGIALWDELFFNLNSVSNGPQGGLDQNRAFIGPNFLVSKQLRFEIGYLNVYYTQGQATDSVMHSTFTVYSYFDF